MDSQPHSPRRSIPLDTTPLFRYGAQQRYLVLPADLSQDIFLCKAHTMRVSSDGAWMTLVEGDAFPTQEEVLLVEFEGREVVTHRARITRRDGVDKIWVENPSLSEREPSQLAPFTGRSDYRVKANLPVQVRIVEGKSQGQQLWNCRLVDLSRGGMSLLGSPKQPFEPGQKVDIRVVSWEYPVRMETEVVRVWPEGEFQRVAMMFPSEMTLNQREMISTFILQVQRREVLSRALPATDEPG